MTVSSVASLVDLSIDLKLKISDLIALEESRSNQKVSNNTRWRPKKAIGPALYPTFLDAEDENGATPYHRPAFCIVEAASDARDYALSSGMD